jgi:MFS transporter, SP family, sugar:H+ symporter
MDSQVSLSITHRFTTFWEEKRVVAICFILAFSQFQYGYDSAAIAGFQSMVGFLQIFGYADVPVPLTRSRS